MVLQDHVTNYKHYISPTRAPTATKPHRIVTYNDWVLPVKPYDTLIMWSCKIIAETETTYYISVTTVPMATKFDRMLTYLERLSPIKLTDLFATWFCEIT